MKNEDTAGDRPALKGCIAMPDEVQTLAGLDFSTPNVARMYDYYLGGKDNFAADRACAEKVLSNYPELRTVVRENRAFLSRAVRFLAEHAGICQFLDIGAGLPTMENVHEVAQAVVPHARIVYVDYDPVVCSHARALLAKAETVTAVQADLREPDTILKDPETQRLIDFSQPVAVLLVAILHFVPDDDDPYQIVGRLRDATVPGSHLVLSHAGSEDLPTRAREAAVEYNRATAQIWFRTRDEVLRFFEGFDLVDPGLVGVHAWRNPRRNNAEISKQLTSAGFVGVARRR